jgi:hypothetical protein
LIASVPGLQSVAQRLLVVRRPDTVIVTSPQTDTIFYAVPDNAGTNVSPALGLKVVTFDTTGGVSGVSGWLISYKVLFHGQTLAVKDTTIASLWNASSVAALVDTAGADGSVSPRLRVRSTLLPTLAESLTVVATVRYRGAPVRGSPVTYLIQLRPK